jgi:hypothetical protein
MQGIARLATAASIARATVLAAALAAPLAARGQPAADDVPLFSLRARVTAAGGAKPDGKNFHFQWSGIASEKAEAAGDGWSGRLPFARPQAEATLKGYPAIYLKRYPLVVRLQVTPVADPTAVEAELEFAGGADAPASVVKLDGELFGPTLGILVWRDDDRKPRAATMAAYNRRYWKHLETVEVPPDERPRRFPFVDRFIGGDDDRIAWREGIAALDRAGFSSIMLPPSAPVRDLLVAAGGRRTSWAVYSPPGYAFDFDPKHTPESLAAWARGQAEPYRKAGYAADDMAVFALSDEPGWYYPQAFEQVAGDPAALGRFHRYLEAQGLAPADLGAATWADVKPLGRGAAKSLPERRLFHWTMRFFAHESARYFADSTRALEAAFAPRMPIFTNWNFFSGRFYVPGPVANNRDKRSPDAAMGGHDWFEFARLRGGTMLWTEDWFGDGQAWQWSFYCAKLRSAAAKGGIEFGGYVIPRTAGDRADGILQKILCVVGSGGKAVKYFVFGPEYNFPGNCYSERAEVLPKMAEAHRLVGKAEELLWPGRRPRPEVAILAPRSAQTWDARDQEIATGINDATNNQLNRSTVDYMAEVFDLYLALQHDNIPVDFVEEEDLSPAGLAAYRVLYVTEPNLPEEQQRGLAEWVRGGGTLVTVTGAAARDRYDEPCTVLSSALGFRETDRERKIIADVKSLPRSATATTGAGPIAAVGPRGGFAAAPEGVTLRFDDGGPAILERQVGKGRAIHFAWMPGMSYWASADRTVDRMPAGFSAAIRAEIVRPARLAGVRPPVQTDRPLVETPLLVSERGAAVTLLNWTGEKIPSLRTTLALPFAPATIESVRHGRLEFTRAADGVTVELPLDAADILLARP